MMDLRLQLHVSSPLLTINSHNLIMPLGNIWRRSSRISAQPLSQSSDTLMVKKQRSRPRTVSSQKLSNSKSMSFLSPTVEEPKTALLEVGSLRSAKPARSLEFQSSSSYRITELTKPYTSIAIVSTPESPERKKNSRQRQPQLSISTSRLPLLTSNKNGSSAAARPRVLPEAKPPSEGNQSSSQSPSNKAKCTVSVQVRKLAASEPGGSSSPDHIMSRKSEGSRSVYAKLEGYPPSYTSEEQIRKSPSGAAQAILAKVSPMNDHNIDIAKDCYITEKPSGPIKSYLRRSTPAPTQQVNSSPVQPHSKDFSSPRHMSPGQAPSANDGSASPKRTTMPKRDSKSGNSDPEDNNTSDKVDHIDIGRPSNTIQETQLSAEVVSGSPRVSVKDLAARFNTANSKISFIPATTTSSTKTSPDEFLTLSEPPKDLVIAPYTTNPQSTTPRKLSTPRRIVKAPTNDTTPLGPVVRSVEKEALPASNALEGQQMDNAYFKKPSPINFSMPRTLRGIERVAVSMEPLKTSKTFGSNRSITVLAISGSPPSPTSHTDRAAPRPLISETAVSSHCGTRTIENCRSPEPSPIPVRSNSVLHSQVRTLQRQLDLKTEQIRQLKHQLENKGTLDIGSLSKQLQEAKRDSLAWKARAEVAEKQIEVMGKLSIKRRPSTSILGINLFDKLNAISNNEGVASKGQAQKLSRTVDGASSPQRDSSQASNETILHDLTLNESEHASWAGQIGIDVSSDSLLAMSPNSRGRLDLGSGQVRS